MLLSPFGLHLSSSEVIEVIIFYFYDTNSRGLPSYSQRLMMRKRDSHYFMEQMPTQMTCGEKNVLIQSNQTKMSAHCLTTVFFLVFSFI